MHRQKHKAYFHVPWHMVPSVTQYAGTVTARLWCLGDKMHVVHLGLRWAWSQCGRSWDLKTSYRLIFPFKEFTSYSCIFCEGVYERESKPPSASKSNAWDLMVPVEAGHNKTLLDLHYYYYYYYYYMSTFSEICLILRPLRNTWADLQIFKLLHLLQLLCLLLEILQLLTQVLQVLFCHQLQMKPSWIASFSLTGPWQIFGMFNKDTTETWYT